MTDLVSGASRAATAAMAGTLVGVGLMTAGLLHLRARSALDATLVEAAFAGGHPWDEPHFPSSVVVSAVDVRPWRADDPLVPRALHDEAERQEAPRFYTLGDRRVVLMVLETTAAADGGEHPHFVVVAEAPAVTIWDAAAPFLGIYGLVAGMAGVVGGWAVRRSVSGALRPLSDASDALARLRVLGTGARLERGGPREVDQLLATTNDLLDRLDAAWLTASSFTASAAHELRTPLTALLGELDLALRRPRDGDAYRAAITRAREGVLRLAALVEALTALARVDAGQIEAGLGDEDLDDVVADAVAAERPGLEAAGCSLRVDVAPGLRVRAQRALLATAVGNLLRNAAVHAPGARVDLRARRQDAWVVVCVEDDGPGVPATERARLLERFQRGRRPGGLGLGLALAREVASHHGGELRLEGAASGGLRVVLSLPFSSKSHAALTNLS